MADQKSTAKPRRRHSPETRAKMSAAHMGNQSARGVVHTAERRAQIVAQLTGRPVSAETRAKMSASAARRKMSVEARARQSERQQGRALTPETRAKISAALTGQRHPGRQLAPPKTEATRLKLRAANVGKTLSVEHRAKLAAAKLGKPQPAEQVERRRQSMLGTKWSPEARARFSEQVKAAWVEGRGNLPPSKRYTKLARALHAHLASTGLTLEPEVRFGRFTVDLYDRAHHIAYEADGAYWHARTEAEKPGFGADRDDYLIQFYGLKVVHFTDKEIGALTGWPKKKKASA